MRGNHRQVSGIEPIYPRLRLFHSGSQLPLHVGRGQSVVTRNQLAKIDMTAKLDPARVQAMQRPGSLSTQSRFDEIARL